MRNATKLLLCVFCLGGIYALTGTASAQQPADRSRPPAAPAAPAAGPNPTGMTKEKQKSDQDDPKSGGMKK